MASSNTVKPDFVADFSEFDNNDEEHARKLLSFKTSQSLRFLLTGFALLSAIVVLGTAGDTLANYNSTKLDSQYILSVWPNEFDIRPTQALVICSAIVMVSSFISLAGMIVSAIRDNTLNFISSFLLPTASLVAALIGTSFFYVVNGSSTNFSLHSWSCQWAPIKMDTKPHWGNLCRESKVALYLTIAWIPVHVVALSSAALAGAGKPTTRAFEVERKGSPAGMS